MGEVNEELYAVAVQAEADMWSNPRATLTQGRLFSEEMATTVSKLEKVEPVYFIKASERVQLLARKDIIADEMKDSFEWLRRNGNTAAHDVKPVPPDLALTAHRHMFTLALWYVESYGPLEIELPTYTMPNLPVSRNDESNEPKLDVGEQLEQLLSAQLEAKILPTITEQFKHLHATISQVAGMNGAASTTGTSSPGTEAANPAAFVGTPPQGMNAVVANIEAGIPAGRSSEQPTNNREGEEVEVGDYLSNQGLTVVDKRPNGGALWVVGGWELKEVLFSLKPQGIFFKYVKNGSQSTKRKPAWFMMGKDPSRLRWVDIPDEEGSTEEVAVAQEAVAAVVASAEPGLTEHAVMLEELAGQGHCTSSMAGGETGTQVQVRPPSQGKSIHTDATQSARDLESVNDEKTELRKSFHNKELIFPASMIDMGLDDLPMSGCARLLQYLKDACNVTAIHELPEDLSNLTEKISGVGSKTVERFVKQLEDAIAEEKRLIGSGKRKEHAVSAYRELKKRLGHRPTYMELHQFGKADSQAYRQLFDSYYAFLRQAGELTKEEAGTARRYADWLQEVESTMIRKSYKMVLLLVMLERGVSDWMKPITAEEAAPLFYQYYMSDADRKQIDFSDNETQKLWNNPVERTAQLIARMPMTHWAKGNQLIRFSDGAFDIRITTKETDQTRLYAWTKEICEYRLCWYFERKAAALSIDSE
ncbi:restriction subunit [Paenibacillus popilliae ATCC 14706]|uniref:Restriction subunit n=1 Tax=Paenibacillus popilliae ATCC 14706 TaxID=1212764 RepID=M9M7F1_PAEPP|nr:restriction subunit [Paenibacillus popilliae ATCC 14706]